MPRVERPPLGCSTWNMQRRLGPSAPWWRSWPLESTITVLSLDRALGLPLPWGLQRARKTLDYGYPSAISPRLALLISLPRLQPPGIEPLPEYNMACILAISNQKGGVGKTTTSINLAAALASAGQRVLLVDLDPQGNASSGLGLLRSDEAGVYLPLVQGEEVADNVRETSMECLQVLPASQALVGAEVELVDQPGRERCLRRALDTVRGAYDWILIDCPPSLGLLTINALVAADRVLVPLQAEYYAMEGLSQLLRTIAAVRQGLNPDLVREGIVVTMYDQRNNLCREVAEQAAELFGREVFETRIPRNVRLGEAPSHGCAIVEYAPKSTGAQAYVALAQELLERHGVLTPGLREAQ